MAKLAALLLSIFAFVAAASPSPATPLKRHISLVAIGDSLPWGRADCGYCKTFVDLYATAIAKHAHVSVTEHNLSEHTGIDSTHLRNEIRSSSSLRRALAAADVITVTIGHNDPPWNNDHDSCDGAGGYPHADYAKYGARCVAATASLFRSNLDAILKTIVTLRAGKATILRVTDDYNDSIGDPVIPHSAYAIVKPFYDRDAAAACDLARKYHGICIDTYHAFNGPSGTRDATRLLGPDHTHPNATGHKLIARLLERAGYRPLFP